MNPAKFSVTAILLLAGSLTAAGCSVQADIGNDITEAPAEDDPANDSADDDTMGDDATDTVDDPGDCADPDVGASVVTVDNPAEYLSGPRDMGGCAANVYAFTAASGSCYACEVSESSTANYSMALLGAPTPGTDALEPLVENILPDGDGNGHVYIGPAPEERNLACEVANSEGDMAYELALGLVPCVRHGLVVTGSGYTPHEGNTMYLAVTDLDTGAIVARGEDLIAGGNFSVHFGQVLPAGHSFQLDFFAEFTMNGMCDPPPTDHVWRRTADLETVEGDVAIAVTHSINFEPAACESFADFSPPDPVPLLEYAYQPTPVTTAAWPADPAACYECMAQSSAAGGADSDIAVAIVDDMSGDPLVTLGGDDVAGPGAESAVLEPATLGGPAFIACEVRTAPGQSQDNVDILVLERYDCF